MTKKPSASAPKEKKIDKKKVAPHWMDCNCVCHGFIDNDGASCPHCSPTKYPNYQVIDTKKYCVNPLHYLPTDILCSKWHLKLSEWKKVKANYEN